MLRRMCVFFTVIVLGCLFLPTAQAQNPCETALQSTAGVLDLSPSSPITIDGAVAEWESEIIKFRVSQTGLLSLGVEETGADAGFVLDEDLVAAARELLDADGEHGDAVLVEFYFFGDADDHEGNCGLWIADCGMNGVGSLLRLERQPLN